MESTTAILLRRTRLTETSLIVSWLTSEQGRLKTVAKGARGPKSKFAGLLDLFYEAEISFARSRRSDLHILREVALRDPHEGLRQQYARVQLAAYFVELIELTTESEHPVPELFDLLRRALAWLEAHTPTRRALVHFEAELTRLLGIGSAPSPIVALGRVYHRIPSARPDLLRTMDATARAKPILSDMSTEQSPQAPVAALFDTREAADAALADLETSGFDRDAAQLFTGENLAASEGILDVNEDSPALMTPPGVGVMGPLGGIGGGLPMGVTAGSGGLWPANAYLGARPEHRDFVHREVSGGRMLITVEAGEKYAIARTILERNGGHTDFESH